MPFPMFRQIEKSDGAVIGNLVATGAQMNFKNMLSAVRTAAGKNMDVRVDDGFGGLEERLRFSAFFIQISFKLLHGHFQWIFLISNHLKRRRWRHLVNDTREGITEKFRQSAECRTESKSEGKGIVCV